MLAKRGWTEITVVEKRAAADYCEPDKSYNYLIDARGQKFTDLLGLTEQLSTIGVAITEFCLTRIQPDGSRKTLKTPLEQFSTCLLGVPKGVFAVTLSRNSTKLEQPHYCVV